MSKNKQPRPAGNRVLVRPSAGSNRGTVVAVGPKNTHVQPGNQVRFCKGAGSKVGRSNFLPLSYKGCRLLDATEVTVD